MELVYLFVIHHFGDVWAQPSWLIEMKKKHLFSVFEHAMVYTGILSIGMYVFGIFAPWKLFFILIGHFLIDATKYRWLPEDTRCKYNLIYIDQFLHYMQIVMVYYL